MIFATYWFLLFAVVAVLVFRLLPGPAWRQAWLAVACAVFHWHFAGPAGVKPIIVLMIITYLAGISGRRWASAGWWKRGRSLKERFSALTGAALTAAK